ncbi:MAG: hypothetical protein PHZ04_02010 [Patescibacteria group bacterium]|nr:hypothetical protein [Patescibacteria group bacterium]
MGIECGGTEEQGAKIRIENCPICSSPIFLNTTIVDFVGLNFLGEEGEVIFNISRHVFAPCLNCGEIFFKPYHEYLALCAEFDMCPN